MSVLQDLDALSLPTPIQEIENISWAERGVRVYIKRDDLIHPLICGNKWRKLKYSLADAKEDGHRTLVTFGGPFSNHLVATAAAARMNGFNSVGFVRAYSLDEHNPTISLLDALGMRLYPLKPVDYRQKEKGSFVQSVLPNLHGAYIIPEGGTCELALPGIRELFEEINAQMKHGPDVIVLPVGSGGTIAGLIKSGLDAQIIGITPFRGVISTLPGMEMLTRDEDKPVLIPDVTGKPFARYVTEVSAYINAFYSKYNILLDPVYTGRTMMTLDQMIHEDYFKPCKHILFLHTGGLQGILGYNYLHRGKLSVNVPGDYMDLLRASTTLG